MCSLEQKQCINCFNNLIKRLVKIINYITFDKVTDEMIYDLKKISDEDKLNHCISFNAELNKTNNFKLFVDKKNKLLSSSKTISNSLLKDINIYDLLANQNDKIKEHIWSNLHSIFISSEYLKEKENRDIDKLSQLCNVYGVDITSNKLNLSSSINEKEKGIYKDIVDDIVNNLTDMPTDTDLLSNIMNMSATLTEKYKDKIEEEGIDIDGKVKDVLSTVPNLGNLVTGLMGTNVEEKSINIEDPKVDYTNTSNVKCNSDKASASADNIDSGINMQDILKIANKLDIPSILSKDKMEQLLKNNKLEKILENIK